MEAYHGTSAGIFDSFSLGHALEGDGKVKFGWGVYVTEKYGTAAHYAFNKHRPENKEFYVYTVSIPDRTDDNCLSLLKGVPVAASIVRRVEANPDKTAAVNFSGGERNGVLKLFEKAGAENAFLFPVHNISDGFVSTGTSVAWFSLLARAFQPGLDLLLRMKVFFSGICDAVGANPASPANPGRIDKRKPIWTPFMDDMKRSGPLTMLP